MNSTETQHSGDVFSCMLNIQHALKKHDTYKNNYQVMLQLPIVRKLKEQNKRLKQQVRVLLNESKSTKPNTLRKTEKLSDASSTLASPTTASSPNATVLRSASEACNNGVLASSACRGLMTSTLGSNSDIILLEAKKQLESDEDDDDDDDDDVVIISDTTSEVVIKIEKNLECVQSQKNVEQIDTSKPKNNVVYEVIETINEVEVVEEEEEEEEEEEVEVVEEEEEEEEYEEVTINGVEYCTCDKENGSIFELTEDGDIGVEKGIYKNGKPCMY